MLKIDVKARYELSLSLDVEFDQLVFIVCSTINGFRVSRVVCHIISRVVNSKLCGIALVERYACKSNFPANLQDVGNSLDSCLTDSEFYSFDLNTTCLVNCTCDDDDDDDMEPPHTCSK